MRTRRWPTIVGFLAVVMLVRPSAVALDLADLLPKSGAVGGWSIHSKPASYNRANLYDYIDGGADLYLGYAFTRAAVADYVGPDGARITIELYDMGSSYDAFGVFAHEQAGENPPIGQGASYAGGLLTFWKDRIFARIFADRETPATRVALLKFGKLIAGAIRATGPKPPLLRRLPQAGIDAKSVHYLHVESALNNVLYLPGNPLRLNAKTDVAYGEYPHTKSLPPVKLVVVKHDNKLYHPKPPVRLQGVPPAKVVVVKYANPAQALAAYRRLAALHERPRPQTLAPQPGYTSLTKRYKWVGAFSRGPYVVIVSNAPTEATVRRLLKAAAEQVP